MFFGRATVEDTAEKLESMNAVEDVMEAVSEEDFCASEREAVEQAEAELEAALDARQRLSDEMEIERERQLDGVFDGERILDIERRVDVAGRAIGRARERLAIAKERLQEKEAEHRQLQEESFRDEATKAVDHLHRQLLQARRASDAILDLRKLAQRTLGDRQTAVPHVPFPALHEGDADARDPVARWRAWADRRLRGEE